MTTNSGNLTGSITSFVRTALRPPLRRAIVCLTGAAWLAACANHAPPVVSQLPEAQQYAAHARGDYTPPGPPDDPWGPYINEAAKRFDVPDRWIRQVMRIESGGKLYHGDQLVTSWAGAMGLMQVMPHTYDGLRDRYSLGDDPFDPHDNIMAGTAYLREMYDMYGSPGFLAAYNAGPRRLDDYLANIRALPAETRRYVAMIGPYIMDIFPKQHSPAEQYAMNTLPTDIPAGLRYGGASNFVNDNAPVEVASAPADEPSVRVVEPRETEHYARAERRVHSRIEYASVSEPRHIAHGARGSQAFASAAYSAHGWHVVPTGLSEPVGRGHAPRVITVGAYGTETAHGPAHAITHHGCAHPGSSKACPARD
jgi:Transglycosylase SLT domain